MNPLFYFFLSAYLLALSVCSYAAEDDTKPRTERSSKRSLSPTEMPDSTESLHKKAKRNVSETLKETASGKESENLVSCSLQSSQDFSQEQVVEPVRMAELARSEDEREQDMAGKIICLGMLTNAAWAHDKLAELTKSEDGREQSTARLAIHEGMLNNAAWAPIKLAEFVRSEDKKERDMAARAIYGGMKNNAAWAHDKLADLAKSEDKKERDVAARAIYQGMQNNAAWAPIKLTELARSEGEREPDMAWKIICLGMLDNAAWAPIKLTELARSGDERERDMAGKIIYLGMQKNAVWAPIKLAELVKSEDRKERETAEHTVQHWIQSTSNTQPVQSQFNSSIMPQIRVLSNETKSENDRSTSTINNGSPLIPLSVEELNNRIQSEVKKALEEKEHSWTQQFSSISEQVKQLHEENKDMAERLNAIERVAGNNQALEEHRDSR